jgi:ribulose-phosphate 3-epimerase
MLNESAAAWIHIDVMDGVFVPNISFGFPVLEAIRKHTTKFLDCHLMIEKPERYIAQFAASGANMITVHAEACPHLHRTIQQIKSEGCLAGVAINPGTPVSVLEDVIGDLDLALIMSVNPGFGGQKFISNAINKTAQLKALIDSTGKEIYLEIDGGVNQINAAALHHAGANVLVAGSFVFASADPKATIQELVSLA